MKTRAWQMADGGWNPRSVLECGDWRGTGLAPLWNESSARVNPVHAKAACALTPHPPQSKTWRMFVAATRQSAAILTCSNHRRFSKRRYAGLATLALCILTSAFCLRAHAQTYSIDWYKISGGGGTSTGGVYQVTGTIGQPDAGVAMTGGNYSLTGGFWSLIAVVQTAGLPNMTITHSGNSVIVSWPNTGSYTLQQNGNLAASAGWTTSGYSISTSNGTNSITITSPVGNLFFRLRNP